MQVVEDSLHLTSIPKLRAYYGFWFLGVSLRETGFFLKTLGDKEIPISLNFYYEMVSCAFVTRPIGHLTPLPALNGRSDFHRSNAHPPAPMPIGSAYRKIAESDPNDYQVSSALYTY